MAVTPIVEDTSGVLGSVLKVLSPGIAAAGVAGLFFCYIFGVAIYRIYFHPLAKFPGPKLWAATRIPYAWLLQRGRLPQNVKVLHDKYGKVVRIAPNELSFIEGSAWKDIYQPKPGHGPFDKWDVFLNPGINGAWSILTAPDNRVHARIKRLISHGFSDKALRAQEEMFQGHVNLLIHRLRETIASGQKNLNMFNWYTWATSDIMGDLTFGEDFGCLKEQKNNRWISILITQFVAVVHITSCRFFPITAKLLQYCLPKSVMERRYEIHNYAVEKVDKRMNMETSRPDFMYYVKRHNDEKGMSREEIDMTFSTLIIAGGETTAAFLSGVTFYLVQYPEVLKKLQNEIRTTFKSEDEITAATTLDLPYFTAVVKEGLRLTPAVPFGHPRFVRKEGDWVSGHFLPGGTKLSLMAWAAYHSERNFKNAETFDPERWITHNGYDDQSAFEPFSLGARMCIGKNLALVELKLILARVMFNFDMAVPDGKKEMGWDWGDQGIFMLWRCDPMHVEVQERKDLKA